MTAQKCYLKCVDNRHPPIFIDETETFIGRSPETLIQDLCCSRHQVSVQANMQQLSVVVKQKGLNASAINGLALQRNEIYKAFHGDQLEVLHNSYVYEFVFDPPPSLLCEVKSEPVDDYHKRKERFAISKEETVPSKRTNPDATLEIPERKKIKLSKAAVPASENTWESIDSDKMLIFTGKGVRASNKIASYDIDGTIIKTKSGNVFPKNSDDWQLAYIEVPGKLKEYLKNGYKIVFFTNQAGMSTGKTKESDWKKKLESIVQKLNIPVQVFVSTGNGMYRKPRLGMWEALVKEKNDGIDIDMNDSFYVGDAAGRPEKKLIKRKKDHSLADRLFAINIGIKFYTPEEHFQNAKTEPWSGPEFDPKEMDALDLLEPKTSKLKSGSLEVIVMVGGPGSGKSSFAKNKLHSIGFTLINRDTLKTWQKCVEHLENTLKKNQNAVIDNTNPDKESRQRYIAVARKVGATCRCFVMATSYHQSKHNNVFRELTDPSHAKVNDMVINGYKKKYQEPTLSEGFSEIVKVNFIPDFKNGEHEKLYKMHLLEK